MPMPPACIWGVVGQRKVKREPGGQLPLSHLAKYIKETSGKEPHLGLTLPLLDLLACLLLESLCAVMSYRDRSGELESCFRFRFPQLDPTILWATKDPRLPKALSCRLPPWVRGLKFI